MELIWVMVGFFAFITLVFIAVAYFLPEWIGITGKKALEIEEHQKTLSDTAANNSTEKS